MVGFLTAHVFSWMSLSYSYSYQCVQRYLFLPVPISVYSATYSYQCHVQRYLFLSVCTALPVPTYSYQCVQHYLFLSVCTALPIPISVYSTTYSYQSEQRYEDERRNIRRATSWSACHHCFPARHGPGKC